MIDDGVPLILIIPMLHLSRSLSKWSGENTEDYQNAVLCGRGARNISSEPRDANAVSTNVGPVYTRALGRREHAFPPNH